MQEPHRWYAWTLAGSIFLVQAAAGFPSPLYPRYQTVWSLSDGVVTLLFPTLIVGVVLALLVSGTVARLWGHLATLATSLVVGTVAVSLFATDLSPSLLFVGALLQGMAVGGVSGSAAPLLSQALGSGRSRSVGPVFAAATATGIAAGPLLSGLLLDFDPLGGRSIFIATAALLLATCLLAVRLHPLTPSSGGAGSATNGSAGQSSPADSRAQSYLLLYCAGFIAFAVGGAFSALSALTAVELMNINSGIALGSVITVLFGANAAAQPLLHKLPLHRLLVTGLLIITVGMAVTLVALATESYSTFVISAIVAGFGQGATIAASTGVVAARDVQHGGRQRLPAFLISCYIGTALPGLLVGPLQTLVSVSELLLLVSITIALSALILGIVAATRSARSRARSTPEDS